jgi:ABC-2 type transport system ATP-binding protein
MLNVLEFTSLTKRYRRGQPDAVHDLSFTIEPGEVVGLVGLNGAGKTSTIRVAAGVSLPTGGDVLVDGFSIRNEKPAASRLIGWVSENPVHDPAGKIGSMIRYYAGISGEVAHHSPAELLSAWGIDGLASRPFRTLSQGERKRFALAVASLHDPTYLLLDEVLSGLDPEGIGSVRRWIVEGRRTQKGFLVSSHQLRELHAIADKIAFVHHGRLLRFIRSSDIPVPSQPLLRISVTPVDDRCLDLLRPFGDVERGSGAVTVRGTGLDGAQINRSLVSEGYQVTRLESVDPDLEVYFRKLIEGSN